MTMPYPSHTALLRDTDSAIRTLAYAADAGLSGTSRVYTTSRTSGPTDGNGEFVADFGTGGRSITGCFIMSGGVVITNGQLTAVPGNPTYTIGEYPVQFFVRQIIGGGQAWVRAMTTPFRANKTGFQYGSQPIKSGVQLAYVGLAWGPA